MPLSAFEDQSRPPGPSEIAATLGTSAPLWERLLSDVADRYPPIHELWHFGGVERGWSLRIKRGERIVLSMTPQREHFLVVVVLAEEAVRLTVSTPHDLRAARELAAAKMAS